MEAAPSPAFSLCDPPLLFQAPPAWRWRRRQGDYWNCWCIIDGRCELRCGGRSFAAGPGHCFLLPPGGAVEADHDLRAPACNLAFHGRLAGWPDPPLHVVLPDPLALRRLAEEALAAWAAGGAAGQAECAALAAALVARIHRHAAPGAPAGDPALAALLLEIRRRPAQAWTVAGCARRAGLSRSQLVRRFQAAYGESPSAAIARCRDDYALQLVRESALPLAEIAALAGYADASHLGRRLRARLGVPPGAVRG